MLIMHLKKKKKREKELLGSICPERVWRSDEPQETQHRNMLNGYIFLHEKYNVKSTMCVWFSLHPVLGSVQWRKQIRIASYFTCWSCSFINRAYSKRLEILYFLLYNIIWHQVNSRISFVTCDQCIELLCKSVNSENWP